MDKVHKQLDDVLKAYKAAGGDKDPQRLLQFEGTMLRAHGIVDESIHYLTNVLPNQQEA